MRREPAGRPAAEWPRQPMIVLRGYLELIARFGLDVLAPEVCSYALEKGHRRSSDEDGRRAEYYPRTAGRFSELTDAEIARMEAVVVGTFVGWVPCLD